MRSLVPVAILLLAVAAPAQAQRAHPEPGAGAPSNITRAQITQNGRTLHTALGGHYQIGLPVDASGVLAWRIAGSESLRGVSPLEEEFVEDASLAPGVQAQVFWFRMDETGTWTVEFHLTAECENSPVEIRTFHFMVH